MRGAGTGMSIADTTDRTEVHYALGDCGTNINIENFYRAECIAYLCNAMDRRHFCKIATLAIGALGIGSFDAKASRIGATLSATRTMPCTCRVTVIRKECYMDIQSLYLDDPDEGACHVYECGDEWIFRPGDSCPHGFCVQAWSAIVSILDRECSVGRDEVRIVSCPDGSRPVVFKVSL